MSTPLGIAALLVSLVATFFLWASLHELAHFLAVKSYRSNATGEFTLYPHRHKERFFWARVSWTFDGETLTPTELAWISVAPRWPDLVGVIGAPICAWLLPMSWWGAIAVVLLGGAVVDLIVGSIGWNDQSDLRRAARGWEISPWALRIPGFLLALGSGAAAVIGFIGV